MFDFQHARAIVVDGHDDMVTLTTLHDMAEVIAKAVDFDGAWPVTGGIRGNRLSISQVLKIGEKVRGRPFAKETVKLEDLEAGALNTTWGLEAKHSAVPPEQLAAMLKMVLVGTLLSGAQGSWDVSDEFNQIIPEYKFTKAEDFLAEIWEGKE